MTSTSWLSRDLNVQALDKMRKLSDSEQTAYECWVYQVKKASLYHSYNISNLIKHRFIRRKTTNSLLPT